MYCRYCGKELPVDVNFCPNCGKKQNKTSKSNYDVIFGILNYVRNHKIVLFLVFAWVLLHTTLYVSSEKNSWCDTRFYPFDMRFSDVIQGGKIEYYGIRSPEIHFLGKSLDYYDFTEFFAYVVLLPTVIWGIVMIVPYIKRAFKYVKTRYNQWKESRKKKEHQVILQHVESADKSAPVKPAVRKSASLEQQVLETICVKTPTNENRIDREIQPKETEPRQVKRAMAVTSPEEMPLLSRFIGSIIDKTMILVVFIMALFVVSFIDSPFTVVDKAAAYHYVLGAIPSNYYYVEHYIIQEAGVEGPHDGVSDFYWHNNRRELQENPPYHGMLLNMDLTLTLLFILWNLLYYYISELFLKASLGKFLTGGIVVSGNNRKINKRNALLRVGMGAFLMLYFVGLRFLVNTNYYVILILFFYVMDLPLLFSKKSLLDILTGTFYGKRNLFLRSQDRVKKYQKRAFDGVSKAGNEHVTIQKNEKEKKESIYIWGCALALHAFITIVAYCIYYFNPETIDVGEKWNYICCGFGIGALSWMIAIFAYRMRGKQAG